VLVDGVVIDHTFSAKPKPNDFYEDYYTKVTTYVAILSGPAQAIDPTVTAKTFSPIVSGEEGEAVFNYIDTSSSRAEIDVVTKRLALEKIAIVGLGGTGSYVLDLVAKTPVKEIYLFDKDEYLQHNAFRSPGAPSIGELKAKPQKVAYLKDLYSKMHRGIIAHGVHIDAENIEQLRQMDFVFLCLDSGTAKRLIVEKLEEFGVSFIDVGMGVYMGEEALGGILRITTSTPEQRDFARARISFSDGDGPNEYARNIQIADLNALNAALAVIKWKKIFGFYLNYEHDDHSTYTIELHQLTKENRCP
jgi:ThiF family